MTTKTPFYSLGALLVFVAGAVLILIFGNTHDPEVVLFLGVAMANIPGLIASFMAEKNRQSLNNGAIQEKARLGATQAITESQVVTRTGPVETAQLQALTRLLEHLDTLEGKANGPTV